MYEIQFHPADIRKPVRYYFLSRAGARWLTAGSLLVGLVLIAGLVLAPLGIQSLLLSSTLARLIASTSSIHRCSPSAEPLSTR